MTAGVPQTEWLDRLRSWLSDIPSILRAWWSDRWADRAVREAAIVVAIVVPFVGASTFLVVSAWLATR